MRIDRRKAAFGLLAVALAALFARLGFWQLERLEEKRALNAVRAERASQPPLRIPPDGIPDTHASPGSGTASSGLVMDLPSHLPPADSLPWRRVEVRGRYDFRHEVLLRGRLRDGRPGVELLTPLRTAAGPAILVHRGWLPAPDGLHAPLDSARDGSGVDRVAIRGIVMPGALGTGTEGKDRAGTEEGGSRGSFRVRLDGEERLALTHLDVRRAAEAVPYPVAPFYVRATDPAVETGLLRDLAPLAFDEGPHLGYAIQWFAFATISIVGAGAYLIRG